MDWRLFATTFGLLFLAELGDKTQLTVITLATQNESPLAVLLGSVLALSLVAILSVVFGQVILQFIPAAIFHKASAVLFVLVGVLLWFEVL
jgi:putative Ca2+/H+ antiporter (TMEM165/GDT1 family)